VFKPLAPVPLRENQRVFLKIEPVEAQDAAAKDETPIPWEEAREQLGL
jgi:predicted DNA-binding antitoxin AbrB/MazE fold protein